MRKFDKKFTIEAAISIILLTLTLFGLSKFLLFAESRTDVAAINDLFIGFLPAADMSLSIFIALYMSLLLALWMAFSEPEKGLLGIQAFIVMVIIRMIVMFLLPLAPPRDFIVLYDPFVEKMAVGKQLTQDLFFSGHTSTSFLLYLVFRKNKGSLILLAASLFIAVAVLVQRAHYTIDVVAAPFFAFGAYKLTKYFKERVNYFSVRG